MNLPPPKAPSNSTAVISLVFGILSWVALPLAGAIVAIVTGHMARGEIRRSPEPIEGDGMAVAGLVLGWTNLAMLLLALLFFIVFFGGMAAFLAMAGS